MDYFAPFWQGFRTLIGRLRYCIWGAGYCDLKDEPSRMPADLLVPIVERSHLCVVRDEMTRLHLGLSDISIAPCPSVSGIDDVPQPGCGVLHVNNYTTVGVHGYDAMRTAGLLLAEKLGCPYRETNNRISSESRELLGNVLSLYARSDRVLSSALHGCIVSVATGRKVIAVSGDWKIEEFMRSAGLGEWVIGNDNLTRLESLMERLQLQPDTKEFLRAARAANRVVARRILALV